ncbi:YrhB domain-containing protein [Streptomyces axinellae]|uniref:Tox-PL domain-containing protein n=1 Tax=Streptomyces axinellae TaxID=552788 RepID=A0ABN3QWX3_9ACTN
MPPSSSSSSSVPGSDPRGQALGWLRATYGGLVELTVPEPVAEDATTWLFACRTVPQPGYPATPMLAASVAVPKDGSTPFHPASNDLWADLADFGRTRTPRTPDQQARRLNARGCVVAVGGGLAGTPAVPLPWSPAHEAPGWWDLLLRRYFPGAERLTCGSWDEVTGAMHETGPGTRGVVWIRREAGGVEVSGHLVHVHVTEKDGQVVYLDGMTGGLAQLETRGLRKLKLARLRPEPGAAPPPPKPPWRRPAPDFTAAVVKAETWLAHTYQEPLELVDPDPADERGRGWLFACETKARLNGGDWSRGMLDAALVVPKDESVPFGLPNSLPWHWLDAWDKGAEPGDGTLPLPPRPGAAAWLPATLAELGAGTPAVSAHTELADLLDELAGLPPGARALIWVRRVDHRGRESVGLVLNAFRTPEGRTGIVDGSAAPVTDLNALAASGFRLIRYR